MKTYKYSICVITMLMLFSYKLKADNKLAVVDINFNNSININYVDRIIIKAKIIDQLRASGSFQVISNEDFRKRKIKYNFSYLNDSKYIKNLSKKLRVDFILVPSIFDLDEKKHVKGINFVLYDGFSGETIQQVKASGYNSINKAMNKLIESLPYQAYVFNKIDNNHIIISKNKFSKIKEGSEIIIFRIQNFVSENKNNHDLSYSREVVAYALVLHATGSKLIAEIFHEKKSNSVIKGNFVAVRTNEDIIDFKVEQIKIKRTKFKPYAKILSGYDYLKFTTESDLTSEYTTKDLFFEFNAGLDINFNEKDKINIEDRIRYDFDSLGNFFDTKYQHQFTKIYLDVQNSFESKNYLDSGDQSNNYFLNSSEISLSRTINNNYLLSIYGGYDFFKVRDQNSQIGYKNYTKNHISMIFRYLGLNSFYYVNYQIQDKIFSPEYIDDNYFSHTLSFSYNLIFSGMSYISLYLENEFAVYQGIDLATEGDEKDSYSRQTILGKISTPVNSVLTFELENRLDLRYNKYRELNPLENPHYQNTITPLLKYSFDFAKSVGLSYSFIKRKDHLYIDGLSDSSFQSHKTTLFFDFFIGNKVLLNFSNYYEFIDYLTYDETVFQDYTVYNSSLFLNIQIFKNLSFDLIANYALNLIHEENEKTKTLTGLFQVAYEF